MSGSSSSVLVVSNGAKVLLGRRTQSVTVGVSPDVLAFLGFQDGQAVRLLELRADVAHRLRTGEPVDESEIPTRFHVASLVAMSPSPYQVVFHRSLERYQRAGHVLIIGSSPARRVLGLGHC